MERFDPLLFRSFLLGPSGYERQLKSDFRGAQSVGGLGHSAGAYVGSAVDCILVGFVEPAERLLRMALEWVDVAIASSERPERYFPDWTEADRFRTKALCN